MKLNKQKFLHSMMGQGKNTKGASFILQARKWAHKTLKKTRKKDKCQEFYLASMELSHILVSALDDGTSKGDK